MYLYVCIHIYVLFVEITFDCFCIKHRQLFHCLYQMSNILKERQRFSEIDLTAIAADSSFIMIFLNYFLHALQETHSEYRVSRNGKRNLF